MPINRVRDGWEEVRHNDETMNKAVEVLRDSVPFCIFAEGTHHPDRTILPLSKGIFRIALQANDSFGQDKPIYIVPVGIEYGDFFHLWTSVKVTIGEAINVTAFVRDERVNGLTDECKPRLMMALREELTKRMNGLVSERLEVRG